MENQNGPGAIPPARFAFTASVGAALAALQGAGLGDPDPADQVAARLDEDVQPEIDAWLAEIGRLLQERPDLTLEALQALLLDLFGDLPTEQLVEVMAQGFALAELVGMDDAGGGA